MHDVALVDEADSGAAVDGRDDGRVVEIYPGTFDRGRVIRGIGLDGIRLQNSGPKAYSVGGAVKTLGLDAAELPPKVITA